MAEIVNFVYNKEMKEKRFSLRQIKVNPLTYLKESWHLANQARWSKQWDVLPLGTLADSELGRQTRLKAYELIEKGLEASTSRLFQAFENGWCEATKECLEQRKNKNITGWPRDAKGRNLIHLACSIPPEILGEKVESRKFRTEITYLALENLTGRKGTDRWFGGPKDSSLNSKAMEAALWNQADHKGVTPWMLAMKSGFNPYMNNVEINWMDQDFEGKTAWHYWAEGVVDAIKEIDYFTYDKPLKPWSMKLRSLYMGSVSNLKQKHPQKAWELPDHLGQNPWDILIKMSYRKIERLLSEDIVGLPDIPHELVQKNLDRFLKEASPIFWKKVPFRFPLNQEQWLIKDDRGNSFLRRVLREEEPELWLAKKGVSDYSIFKDEWIWQQKERSIPHFNLLENYLNEHSSSTQNKSAPKPGPYISPSQVRSSRLVQLIEESSAWRVAKANWEAEHLNEILEKPSPKTSPVSRVRL